MSDSEPKQAPQEGDRAVECFVVLFLLRLATKSAFKWLPQGLPALTTTVAISVIQLICVGLIVVLFRRRIKRFRADQSHPVTWWKWGLLLVATSAWATEPIALLGATLVNLCG